MLASQFLSVVIDEVDGDQARHHEEPESTSSNETSDDNIGSDSNLIQDLEAVCKLPKVLLAECTISLATPEDKLSLAKRECRFDAYVTPVAPKPWLKPIPLARLQEKWKEPEEVDLLAAPPPPPPPPNIEDLLQGVEAVYSDDEEANGSNRDVYRKAICQVCRRGFYSDGPVICRRCATQRKRPGTDEFVPRGFQCKVCGKVYSQRSVLKKHEAVHSGYRLRCKVCGIDFTQRSSLLRHCKRIHGLASDSDIQTPLVPPDLRLTGKMMASTSTTKYVAGLADRLNALLSKKEDTITLAVTKKPVKTIGPYSVDPHTVMTITPDVIIQTDQD